MNNMNEAITTILDKIDFEKHAALDMTTEEYKLIKGRYQKQLNDLRLDEFVCAVAEDCYRWGFAKACINAGLDIPM